MINDRIQTVDIINDVLPADSTTYNGSANASGLGIDMKDYNEIKVLLSVVNVPSDGTVNISFNETDDNTELASEAVAVSDAAFDEIDADSDKALYVAKIDTKGRKRYGIFKVVTANQDISLALNLEVEKDSYPADNGEVFDV